MVCGCRKGSVAVAVCSNEWQAAGAGRQRRQAGRPCAGGSRRQARSVRQAAGSARARGTAWRQGVAGSSSGSAGVQWWWHPTRWQVTRAACRHPNQWHAGSRRGRQAAAGPMVADAGTGSRQQW